MKVDLGNLLLTFDESLSKIIEQLEKGYPDRALIRARETRKTFQAVMKKLTPEVIECVEKRI